MAIRQEIMIAADAKRVFDALTKSEQFAAFTNAPAKIDAQDGGAFSCFDGQITGRCIELIPNERLVQAWRVKAWEPGAYSMVKFTLEPDGDQTKLILEQAGYPEDAESHLQPGWGKMYWEPLKQYLK
jgi:activator of HSP90 ATPase